MRLWSGARGIRGVLGPRHADAEPPGGDAGDGVAKGLPSGLGRSSADDRGTRHTEEEGHQGPHRGAGHGRTEVSGSLLGGPN